MNSTDFRERYEIVRVTHETDEWGDQHPSEEVVHAGYARVTNLSGREYWEAFSQHQESTIKLWCRWHPTLEALDTELNRVRWRGRDFDIISVGNVESRNDVVEIKATEVGR